MSTSNLYQAQSKASEVFQSPWFPCYDSHYVQTQTGWKGRFLKVYSPTYNAISAVGSLFSPISALGTSVGNALDSFCSPVLNWITPVNPINGKRHFVGISRGIEKVLGDYVFYPLASHGMKPTHECLNGTNQSISGRVNYVLSRLKNANKDLLNPPDAKAQFNYRAETVNSSQINAFATPGGGMVVFSQLVKELDGAIKSGQFNETTVQFADGSTAKVDLSGVQLEDALAALLGHEMTHAASRHSIVALMGKLIQKVVLSVGRLAAIVYLKAQDNEYQRLAALPSPTIEEKRTLEQKEHSYNRLNDLFGWLQKGIENLSGLFHSRKNEYEADVTGVYFAHQAGFNPLGALLVQEILKDSKGGVMDFLHRHLEFMFTHPYSENRKRAIFAAIDTLNSPKLKAETKSWDIANNGYDFARSNTAISFAHSHIV